MSRWENPPIFQGKRSRGTGIFQRRRDGAAEPQDIFVQPFRSAGPPLGNLKTKLEASDFALDAKQDRDSEHLRIEGCEYVTSYNWVGHQSSQMLVPGRPPFWTPPLTATPLQEDSGVYFRDQNSARYPSYPLEPMVRALNVTHPDFETASIDLVGCGSTLGNLIRFLGGGDKSFRFLIQAVGKTIFFQRRENTPDEIIPDVRGYGHAFPEAYTTWEPDVKGSGSHIRVITWNFAGLKVMNRLGVDGYLQSKNELEQRSPNAESARMLARKAGEDFAELSEAMSSNNFAQTSDNSGGDTLTIKPSGSPVPQSSIFDLKTRSIRKLGHDTLNEELPRLWLGQIPKFILAHHQSGLFTDIKVKDVVSETRQWELKNQDLLRKFSRLLWRLVAIARDRGGEMLEVRREGWGPIELREPGGNVRDILPDTLATKWKEVRLEKKGSLDEILEADKEIGNEEEDSSVEGKSDEGGVRLSNTLDTVGNGVEHDSSDESVDYTACSADGCGYCGRCAY